MSETMFRSTSLGQRLEIDAHFVPFLRQSPNTKVIMAAHKASSVMCCIPSRGVPGAEDRFGFRVFLCFLFAVLAISLFGEGALNGFLFVLVARPAGGSNGSGERRE